MKRRNIILFILSVLPYAVFADVDQTGDIVRLIVEGNLEVNQTVSVWLSNNPSNSECASDGRWVVDAANDVMAKEKISTLLAAATSNRPVHLHHLSVQGCGPFGAKKIWFVDVTY